MTELQYHIFKAFGEFHVVYYYGRLCGERRRKGVRHTYLHKAHASGLSLVVDCWRKSSKA